MTRSNLSNACRILGFTLLMMEACGLPFAQAAMLPDVVNQPPGIDLGSTSFYDGFGRSSPGWRILSFFRFNDLMSITNADAHSNPAYDDPRITTVSGVIEPIWVSPLQLGGAFFGVTAILPFTSISSHFGSDGKVLTNNNFNVGDVQFGPLLQWKPIKFGIGHVIAQRLSVLVTAPTGAFNHQVNLNQSSGYWSVNPYYAVSYLQAPGWEVSARINYLYNFETTNFGHPPSIPDVIFDNAQAGQAIWLNFATSYAVIPGVSAGINGYYFDQLVNDKVNGINIARSRKTQLYLGPGLHFVMSKTSYLNANLYLPVRTTNSTNGVELNFQFIHDF